MNAKKTFLFCCFYLLSMTCYAFAQEEKNGPFSANASELWGSENIVITSMAEFNGKFYIGTESDQGAEVWSYDGATWNQVNVVGFGWDLNYSARSMAVFNNSLYVGVNNDDNGVEIWRYDGTTWTLANEEGFYSMVDNYNYVTSAWCMEVFGNYLYVGTNKRLVSSENVALWRYDGTTWTPVNIPGYTDSSITSMTTFNSKLYAGATNYTSGTVIWEYDGSTWIQVNTDGFGDAGVTQTRSMEVFGSKLYAGATNSTSGTEIWEYDGSTWTQVNTDGFGDAGVTATKSMKVFGSKLYAGATGAEIWAYDGTTWTQANIDGFGDINNFSVRAMEIFNGKLYAGTGNGNGAELWSYNGDLWGSVSSSGSDNIWGSENTYIYSMAEFNGKFYIGTESDRGTEVWSYDGATWTQVNVVGFGWDLNKTARSMAVFNNSLYVGVNNDDNGVEIWRYDGTTWTLTNEEGFNSMVDNYNYVTSAWCMEVFGNYLYVGTNKRLVLSENVALWRYDGTTWTPVNIPGYTGSSIYSMTTFNNELYFGNWNYSVGTGIFKYDGTTWTQVNTDGFGDVEVTQTRSMEVFGSKLYAGTANFTSGTEIWEYDGSTWTQVNTDGFGDALVTSTKSMKVFGSKLYAGTTYGSTGAEVWAYDGTTWTQVNSDGFGDFKNVSVPVMEIFNGKLYAGTGNGNGAEVWRFDGTSWLKVSYGVSGITAYTVTSLDLSSQTILQNGTIDVSGKLTRLPEDPNVDLSNITISLTVTEPDNSTTAYPLTTYDTNGYFEYDGLSVFAQKGTYTIQATFEGNSTLAASNSDAKTILVGSSAGYAIIVQGKISNDEGLGSHNKTTNRIYNKLKERGFDDNNIYYFNYDTSQTGIIVDALPSKSAIQTAIETWAKDKMNGSPAPLYVIMIDHGNVDTFYINNETITPTELASWLDTLESGLDNSALSEKRIIIYGACYSGSFIPTLSKSGRVIITSAASDEESYKGPLEPDNIRSGEYFMEEFFHELGRGYSFKDSFVKATDKTETFTRKGGNSSNTSNKYFDNSAQHPLMDDNGDGTGTNLLSEGSGDGQVANDLFLGIGITYDTNSVNNPAEILEVADTVYLNATTSYASLWAKTNDYNQEIKQASSTWMEVRPPSKTLSAEGGSNQLELDLTKELMTFNGSTSLWEKTLTAYFTESGMYEIFYFTRDVETENISPTKRSVVYKNASGNNAPGAFDLSSPTDGTETKTVLIFEWVASTDTNGDPVTYNLLIATDSAFSNVVYRKEEITTTATYVDGDAPLLDLTTYYWKIQAVDAYGAKTDSTQTWTFNTNNTNAFPGIITGAIYDGYSFAPVIGASLSTDLGSTAISIGGGAYIMIVPAGTGAITSAYAGYADASVSGVSVSPGGTTIVNIPMTPLAINTTTVDFSNSVYFGYGPNSGAVTITVNLSNESLDTITVNYATGDGTATKDVDYFEVTGILTFSPGKTSKTFTVTPKNGGVSDGTVTLTLSNPLNVILGTTNNPAILITNYIPTLTEWGIIIFTILILLSGVVMLRRKGVL